MNVATFIIVVIVFSAILVHNRASQQKKEQPETSITIKPPTSESDDYIRMLSLNPKEHKDAASFGKEFEDRLEQILSYYQVKNCLCSVEFVTVDLCLVAVIHIRALPGKKKKGIKELWNHQ